MLIPVDSHVRKFLRKQRGGDHLARDLSRRCCFDSLREKLIDHRWWLPISGGRSGIQSGAPESGRAGRIGVLAVYCPYEPADIGLCIIAQLTC
jgi:hypothetical protein